MVPGASSSVGFGQRRVQARGGVAGHFFFEHSSPFILGGELIVNLGDLFLGFFRF